MRGTSAQHLPGFKQSDQVHSPIAKSTGSAADKAGGKLHVQWPLGLVSITQKAGRWKRECCMGIVGLVHVVRGGGAPGSWSLSLCIAREELHASQDRLNEESN